MLGVKSINHGGVKPSLKYKTKGVIKMTGTTMSLEGIISELKDMQSEMVRQGQHRNSNIMNMAIDHLSDKKKSWEERASRKENLSFSIASQLVKKFPNKYAMRLPQWQPDVLIKIQMPDEHSKMTHPYFYAESRFGRVPWIETVVEKFSEKWVVVDLDEKDTL